MDELLNTAATLISERLGLSIDGATIASAVQSLLGNADGELDLAGLASRFAASGGAADALKSWLGDGDNAPISAQTVLDALGQSKVADFASEVGTDTDTAAAGLSDVLPKLLDQASSGGELLQAFGGASGLLGMARSFLK